jgi:hypothetical protein
VNEKKDLWIAGGLSLAVVLLFTVVPYMSAARMDVGQGSFGGFLINPIDGFSYLAKMRQGYEGSWLLELPYAADPGKPTLLYTYHVLLGHVARLLGAPLLVIYHAARALGAFGMYIVGFLFLRRALPDRRSTWAAYLLTLLASGLGWLAEPLGVLSIDLWVPEAIPLLAAYTNAHFGLAVAALIGAALVIIEPAMNLSWRLIASTACGFVLGMVFPFGVGTLLGVFAAWLLWELLRTGAEKRRAWLQSQRERLFTIAALLAAALPWLIYDFWISQSHPVIKIWTAQNQTPSPPLLNTILGFGLVFVLALLGLRAAFRYEAGRLMACWLMVNMVLLYVPFSLQRRLALGLFFPMAGLAALGLSSLVRNRVRILLALTLVLTIPTNLLVIAAGMWGVRSADPALVILPEEAAAFAWLEANAPGGSLVLAGAENGNRLPAFADVRVLYGHPFETPHAETSLQSIVALFTWRDSADTGLDLLRSTAVDWVLYGPRERELGEPTWLEELPLVFEQDQVAIYEVPGR